MNDVMYAAMFFMVGLMFLPIGVYLRNMSTLVYEYKYKYDGPSVKGDCTITEGNVGSTCSVSLIVIRPFKLVLSLS